MDWENFPESKDSAWCFVDLVSQQVAGSSPAFREIFDVGEPANQSMIQDKLMMLGISIASPVEGTGVIQADGKPISLQWTVDSVVDTHQRETGRLIMFRAVNSKDTPDVLMRLRNASRQLETLSGREEEVLDLIYDGHTNKAIAIDLDISEKTVEKHRANTMRKLEVSSLSQLIRLVSDARIASELNIIDPSEDGNPPNSFESE